MPKKRKKSSLAFDASTLDKFQSQSLMVVRSELESVSAQAPTSLSTSDVEGLSQAGVSAVRSSTPSVESTAGYIALPAALVSRVLKVTSEKAASWVSKAQKSLVDTVVVFSMSAKPLKLAYIGAREAVDTIVSSKAGAKEKAADVVANVAVKVAESGAKMAISTANMTAKPAASRIAGWLGSAGNFVVGSVLVAPIVGVAKALYDRAKSTATESKSLVDSVTKGFISGVNSSMFGLIKFDERPIDTDGIMARATAKRWQKYLDNHPNLLGASEEKQHEAYEEWTKAGVNKYLKQNPQARATDLMNISFADVNPLIRKPHHLEARAAGQLLAMSGLKLTGDHTPKHHYRGRAAKARVEGKTRTA